MGKIIKTYQCRLCGKDNLSKWKVVNAYREKLCLSCAKKHNDVIYELFHERVGLI
jgi:hypothetical protein